LRHLGKKPRLLCLKKTQDIFVSEKNKWNCGLKAVNKYHFEKFSHHHHLDELLIVDLHQNTLEKRSKQARTRKGKSQDIHVKRSLQKE
jgi:hypothetical protein